MSALISFTAFLAFVILISKYDKHNPSIMTHPVTFMDSLGWYMTGGPLVLALRGDIEWCSNTRVSHPLTNVSGLDFANYHRANILIGTNDVADYVWLERQLSHDEDMMELLGPDCAKEIFAKLLEVRLKIIASNPSCEIHILGLLP